MLISNNSRVRKNYFLSGSQFQAIDAQRHTLTEVILPTLLTYFRSLGGTFVSFSLVSFSLSEDLMELNVTKLLIQTINESILRRIFES